MTVSFTQVLIHDDGLNTELLWVSSDQLHIPFGAIVAGYKTDGGTLYVARISYNRRWYAGNYDRDKEYAECAALVYSWGDADYRSGPRWELLVVKYGAFKVKQQNL